jgi:AraC-like DNA-binding protein
MTVADIAYSCGFASSQYFATVFRQQFGRTPSAARQVAVAERALTAGHSPRGAQQASRR